MSWSNNAAVKRAFWKDAKLSWAGGYFYSTDKPPTPNHRLWNGFVGRTFTFLLRRGNTLKWLFRDGRAHGIYKTQALKPTESRNTFWICDLIPVKLLSITFWHFASVLYLTVVYVRVCIWMCVYEWVYMYECVCKFTLFYPDSGLCSLPTVTFEVYFVSHRSIAVLLLCEYHLWILVYRLRFSVVQLQSFWSI